MPLCCTTEIPLTKGRVALIDADDYPAVSLYTWHATKNGYAATNINGKYVLMHRLILGATAGQMVDHRNRNGFDNRRQNIRLATSFQNAMNMRSRKPSRELPRGVVRIGDRFMSRIRVNGVERYLGLFIDPTEAGDAYAKAARELHGDFAYGA